MPVDPIAISRSALDVEWQRLQIIAQNLANQNTSRVAGGGSYRPVTLVSGVRGGFAHAVKAGEAIAAPGGVEVLGIELQPGGTRRVYDPTHPDADSAGFVTFPEIDQAREMTMLVKTARVYEANLTALSLIQQMNMRALEIGKR